MANNHGTINNGRLIAQQALRTLLTKFPLLGRIAHNFSNQALKYGESLVAHVPTAVEAVDFDPNAGYVASGVSQADITTTLNQHIHHTYKVTEHERSSTDINLIERYTNVSAHAIGTRIYNALFGLIVADDFEFETVVDPDDFDRSSVIDVGAAMSGRDVLDVGRTMVLNSLLYGELQKDITIVGNNTNPDGRISANVLPDVHGFHVSEYSKLPANDETLVGIGVMPEALGVVTSLPAMPEVREGGRMSVVTERHSRLSVLLRQWYDWKMGEEYRTLTLMFGVAKGHTPNLQRIVTSAQVVPS